MNFLRKLKYLLPSVRATEEREMNDEFESLSAIAAEEAAAGRRTLGNLTLAKEDARAVWGWQWIESLYSDLRYALRVLRKQPGFVAVAIASLALGIGANTAIFRVVDRLLIQALPVHDPDSPVVFEGGDSFSYFAFNEFSKHSDHALSEVFARFDEHRELDTGGAPQRSYVELVTGNYFTSLGVQAEYGRSIVPSDDLIARPTQVAVISHAFWNRQFGGEPNVIGRERRVQGAHFTIVGVAPPEFFGVVAGNAVDVWIPLTTFQSVFPGRNWLNQVSTGFLTVMGRLQPGVSVKQAASMLTPLYVQIDLERFPNMPAAERKSTLAQQLHLDSAAKGISYLRARFSKPLQIVFAMVGLVLLLACVNLMNLQLARSKERRKELAVRLAIGASRSRVIRQLLTESLLISICGGMLGLLLAKPAERGLASLAGLDEGSVLVSGSMDATMLLFVAGVSVVCALLFGLLPAWRATTGFVREDLQGASRTSTAASSARKLGRSLTAIQIALSVFLIAGACLFAMSLYMLTHFDTGFVRSHLAVVDVDATEAGYKGTKMIELSQRLRDRFAALPGVSAATISDNGVLMGRNSNMYVSADGFQPANDRDGEAYYDEVGPSFFSTLGANILAGRDFSERDDKAAPKVTVINEQFAKHFFKEGNPLGKKIYLRKYDAAGKVSTFPVQVVGVVKDFRSEDVRQPTRRFFYLPYYQAESDNADLPTIRFVIRTKLDPKLLFGELRRAVMAEDRTLPVVSIHSADELLNRQLDRDRLLAGLSLSFGVLALLLASVGTYGLISHEVVTRTSEFGIRMALGAQRLDILALVLGEVSAIALIGAIFGIAAALASSRLVTSLVFGLKPNNPAIVLTAAGILLAMALGAGIMPARRAARLEPMEALRHE